MRKQRLFTPGPTPLAPEAQEAMGRPLLHHRTPEFQQIFTATRDNLKKIFRTDHDMVILASSGTGGMEAAVCNLLGTDDPALAVVAGKFGERWVEICRSYGIPCHVLEKEYGEAATVEEIREALVSHPGTTALLVQGCETSTGTWHELEAIGRLIRSEFPDVLIVVDGITAIGCQRVECDSWGLDVVISGSQKAFAVPPGLAFLSISPRALERMERNRSPGRYYFDLVKEARNQAGGKTSYTAAVSLVTALHATTESMMGQGIERVLAETETMAEAVRAGLSALGFRLLSKAPANATTAAFPPDAVSAAELSARLQDGYGVKVAGGQGPLKGKIIRIAHLGYFDLLDMMTVLSALEMSLMDLGIAVEPGQGVGAAVRVARAERKAEAQV